MNLGVFFVGVLKLEIFINQTYDKVLHNVQKKNIRYKLGIYGIAS